MRASEREREREREREEKEEVGNNFFITMILTYQFFN